MAIISTFDPKFQNQILQKSVNEYGAENVIHIRKSKLFLWFYVIFPALGWFITLIGMLTLIILLIPSHLTLLIVSLTVIIIITRSIPGYKIAKYLMDYYMDFSIITPQSFIMYDQTGFLKRTSKVIDLDHVRSVSVEKAGLIDSIFNNGNIVVLSEGSDMTGVRESKVDPGKIYFRYVKNPEYYSEQIEMLLKKFNENNRLDN